MINSLAVDKNDNIWAATQNGGVGKYDGVKWTIYNSINSGLKSNFIQSIAVDKNNRIWIGTKDKGIAVLDDQPTDVEEHDIISTISMYPNPVKDYITMSGNNNQRIQIYSILGNKVLDTEYQDEINVSKLLDGVYFIRSDNYIYRFIKY